MAPPSLSPALGRVMGIAQDTSVIWDDYKAFLEPFKLFKDGCFISRILSSEGLRAHCVGVESSYLLGVINVLR